MVAFVFSGDKPMYHSFHFFMTDGFGFFIFMMIMIFAGVRRNQRVRRRHYRRDQFNGSQPYHYMSQGNQYPPFGPPAPPAPPSNIVPMPPSAATPPPPYANQPYNYGPGPVRQPFNGMPGYTQPYAPLPVPPTSNPGMGWQSPATSPANAWPEPVVPSSRVISSSDTFTDPNRPTKDIFVWGKTVGGWIYAGKLTVAKLMSESEIRQYAEGKFGTDLKDKLCIEADNFEQARYIFEQSRNF